MRELIEQNVFIWMFYLGKWSVRQHTQPPYLGFQFRAEVIKNEQE